MGIGLVKPLQICFCSHNRIQNEYKTNRNALFNDIINVILKFY